MWACGRGAKASRPEAWRSERRRGAPLRGLWGPVKSRSHLGARLDRPGKYTPETEGPSRVFPRPTWRRISLATRKGSGRHPKGVKGFLLRLGNGRFPTSASQGAEPAKRVPSRPRACGWEQEDGTDPAPSSAGKGSSSKGGGRRPLGQKRLEDSRNGEGHLMSAPSSCSADPYSPAGDSGSALSSRPLPTVAAAQTAWTFFCNDC